MQKTLVLFLIFLNALVVTYFFVSLSYLGHKRKTNLGATVTPIEFLHQNDLSSDLGVETDQTLFRGGATREGRYEISSDKIRPRLSWISEKINAGIHTASKATPIVDSTGIYVGTDLGIFYRFSFDGKIAWSFKTDSFIQGIHGSASLDKDSVYFGNYKGYFYSLEKTTGKLRWLTLLTEGIGSSPVFWNDDVLVSAEYSTHRQGLLFSLDRRNGKKIWSSQYFGEQVHSSPAIEKTNRMVGVGDNKGVFHGIDLISGETKWTWVGYEPIKSTAVVVGEQFCFTTWERKLVCLDANTGQTNFEIAIGSKSQSSPSYDGSQFLYFTTTSGELFKVNLNDKQIESTVPVKKSTSRRNYGMPSPIILQANKNKYFVVTPCFERFICFYDSKLKLHSQVDVSGMVTGSLSVYREQLFGMINNGGLFKIQLF